MNSEYLAKLIENIGVNNLLEAEGEADLIIDTDDSIEDGSSDTTEFDDSISDTALGDEGVGSEEVVETDSDTNKIPDVKILNLTSTQEQYNNRILFEGMSKLIDSIDQSITELDDSTWDSDDAYRIIAVVVRRLTYLKDQLKAYQLAYHDSAEQNLQSYIIFANQYKVIMNVIDKMNKERLKSLEEN